MKLCCFYHYKQEYEALYFGLLTNTKSNNINNQLNASFLRCTGENLSSGSSCAVQREQWETELTGSLVLWKASVKAHHNLNGVPKRCLWPARFSGASSSGRADVWTRKLFAGCGGNRWVLLGPTSMTLPPMRLQATHACSASLCDHKTTSEGVLSRNHKVTGSISTANTHGLFQFPALKTWQYLNQ